ncbi:MAG: hypothetical protein ACREPM_04160, partial [Gemmatimonadaceae bacterium]
MKRLSAAMIVAGSVLVGAGMCEALVRRIAPQDARIQTPGMYVGDSATAYRLAPSHSGVLSNRVEY